MPIACANALVRRVIRAATNVADMRVNHTSEPVVATLRTPKSAHAHNRVFRRARYRAFRRVHNGGHDWP